MSVAVITHPLIDLKTLAQAVESCLDTNPLRETKGKLGSLEHYTSLVESFKPGYSDALTHVGVLIAIDARDATGVLEALSMPHFVLDTKFRDASLIYAVGSVAEYKAAFIRPVSTEVKGVLQEISYAIGTGRINV